MEIIKAVRCIECGALEAVERAQQPELDRRLRAAIEELQVRAREAGLPPYLAAAPVPAGVQVTRRRLCRACAREAAW